VSSGGFEEVFGSAVATTVAGGGSQTVAAGGSATGAVLDGVGLQTVLGFAGGTVVGSGDRQLVSSGGAASGTAISSGGLEVVLSGGVTSDTVIAGGTLELDDGAGSLGAITFSGIGGELAVKGATTPATVKGFAASDVLDEALIAFAASDTAKLDQNNLLTVSGGGTSVSVQFDGSVAGKAFTISDDGAGGVKLSLTSDTTAPVVVSASLSVSGGAGATAIGIAAPSDPDNAGSALTISVTALPANGTVTLADGTTAVTIGESLTLAQLTGLEFTPGKAAGGSSSSFTYSVSDPAGNTTSGSATLSVKAVSLFDFVFTYQDGLDYYQGTVADDGTFGYAVGQSLTTSAGQYTVVGKETTATSEVAGTVFVANYSHGGPGASSSVPVKTAAGTADGTAGLGSESDTLLGVDGLSHAFSSTQEASFPTTRLYGFVFNYADGAFYTGTVADNSSGGPANGKMVTDSSGNVLGVYTTFSIGLTTRASGTVVIDRFLANGTSVLANHSSATSVDGTEGLGSEVGSLTVGQVAHSFSPTSEPVVTEGASTASVVTAPSSSTVVTSEVDQIFSDLLGRLPTQSELTTYSGEINGGTSLSDVRTTLADASEAQSDLKGLYQQVFGRAATTSELSTATSDLVGGSSLSSLQQGLANSSEAVSDIEQVYSDVLNQTADASGLASFEAALGNETVNDLYDPGGLSGIAGVRDVLAHSGEAADALTSLFSTAVGRAPATVELVGMEDQLAIKGNTEATLKSDLSATGSAGGYTTISAQGGTQTLTAAKTPTLFGFSDIAFTDTINSFDVSQDTIQLPKALAADFTTLKNDTTSVSGGSLITLGANQSIFLSSVAPSKLTAGNFLLL
jgi:autotransporter passenger strand-loop-strand repeat protein